MNNSLVKYTLKLAPIIFYSLLTFFLILYLTRIDYSKFSDISIHWFYLLIATLFGIGVRFWGAYVWIVLLNQISGKKINHITELVYVYAKSWLARYIPGTAAWIISKVYFASKYGISKNKLAVSSLLESGLQVTVVMASALALLLFDNRFNLINNEQRLLMLIALACCIIALIPTVFNKIVSIIYKIYKKKSFSRDHYINYRLVMRGTALYLIWSLLGGISLFFIAKAIYPELGYDNMLFVMGVGNLAGALSMLAFFAPSGLGVREGIQLLLLSLIIPTEIALVITVATRLWGTIIDFVFYGIAYAFYNFNQKQKTK